MSQGKWSGCLSSVMSGLFFFVLGLGLIFGVPMLINLEADRYEEMTVSSAIVLGATPAGEDVLIAGRISGRTEANHTSLVAYEHSREQRTSDGETEWQHHSNVTPPLIIDMPDGAVRVSRGYSLEETPQRVFDDDERYEGFAVGDRVVVIGYVSPGGDLPQINADLVTGASRQQFVEGPRTGAWCVIGLGILVCFGGVSAIVSAVMQAMRKR